MTLERLQLIATIVAASPHKIRWLTFWSSGTHTREAFHFLAKEFTEKKLEAWLNRASFWASLRNHCP
jgi:hypothetical protein